MTSIIERPTDSVSRIKGILADETSVPVSEIREHHRLAVDLGIDSLAGASVLIELEDAFDISIHDIQWQAVDTVQHLIVLVDALVLAREQAR